MRHQCVLVTAIALAFGALASGCDSGGGGAGDAGTDAAADSGSGDVAGVISGNHGHVAVLTAQQLEAGEAVDLDIQGTASHSHTLSLTGAQIVSVRDGSAVEQESSITAGHSHFVTFN